MARPSTRLFAARRRESGRRLALARTLRAQALWVHAAADREIMMNRPRIIEPVAIDAREKP